MSLRAKLVRTMVGTLVVVATVTLMIVAGLNVIASRKTLKSIEGQLRASIQNKGMGMVSLQALAMRDMVMDNAFGDVARLIERTVGHDEQIVYGLFLDQNEKAWGFSTRQKASKDQDAWKSLKLSVEAIKQTSEGVETSFRAVLGQSTFEFAASVVDDKGAPLGKLFYGLSDRPLRQALAEARSGSRRALSMTVGLLVLLGIVAIVSGVQRSRRSALRITRPLTELTEAVNTLTSGKRDIRVQITSGDELEILGAAFNKMAAELQDSYARLESLNRTLEVKVQERTRELADRNRDMRLVMDNVNQGFLTVSLSGELAQERSAIVDRWFGAYEGGTNFVEYISKSDPVYGKSFWLGYQALIEDVLPRDLCLDQMPARLSHNGREYRCSYFPIPKGDQIDGLLIVINDVTSELLHARQDAERQEILAMFEGLTKDRTGLIGFMDEANELMSHLHTTSVTLQKHCLHTLKGNAGLMGLSIIAKLCHQAEDDLEERAGPLPDEALAPLEERWRTLNEAFRGFLGGKGRDVVELDAQEVERLEKDIRAGVPASSLLDRLASWWLESAELPLRRLGRHALALAGRLGKGELDVEIQSNDVLLAPKRWAGFWSDLVHVVRNAVDHGIETPCERQSAGKPKPTLRLSTRVEEHKLVVEVEDDGRGVNWTALKAAADKMNLPSQTQEDLVRAMFASGLSTAAEVTTVSGRGVGLSAVRQQVEDLGGHISVISKPGQGTCFRFSFDLAAIGPRFGVDASGEYRRPSGASA
jgi:two-component system chemotaxis sensor kinase CheA